MKKGTTQLFCIFLVLLLFIQKGYAQQKTLVGLSALASYNIADTPFSKLLDPKFGYGIEANAMHFFYKNIFVNTGLSYLNKGYTCNLIDTRFLYNSGSFNPNNITYYKEAYNLDYLSLPLSLGVGVLNKEDSKISLFVMGGLQLNYMVREKVTEHLVDGD